MCETTVNYKNRMKLLFKVKIQI